MPGMRDQFADFYVPDENAIATGMKTGLIVPDANVLLDLYRFQATARDELFGALEKVSDRLWVPYQVALEFQRNRLGVMKDQEGYFAKTRDEVLNAVDGLHGKVRAFGNRLGLGTEQTKEIDDAITELNSVIAHTVLKAEGLNEVRLLAHASDGVLARIDALFEDRVGSPMEPGELEAARKEAKRRITEKIPPGYKDRGKEDPTGDYIVWRQTMTEAASRKIPVVFITNDSRSDDWYRREHGLTLGARRELREEMNREAGVPLLMMTTETFLRHAKTYLDATVSEETVDQAKGFRAFQIKSRPRYIDPIQYVRSLRDAGDIDVLPLGGDDWDRAVIESIRSRRISTEMAESQRAEFEEALQVNPLKSERDEIESATRIIKDYLGWGQATGEDTARAAGWLIVRDGTRSKQDDEQEPQDEPSAEDL